ncbi:MAG: general stress protein CsbD [Bacteroidia bacterium]|nr:general stress protein CsbD [Bacteroidia bacterium]
MKNSNELKESWKETKELLKQKLSSLTAEGCLIVENKKDEVMEKLQTKLGKTKEEIHKLISEL